MLYAICNNVKKISEKLWMDNLLFCFHFLLKFQHKYIYLPKASLAREVAMWESWWITLKFFSDIAFLQNIASDRTTDVAPWAIYSSIESGKQSFIVLPIEKWMKKYNLGNNDYKSPYFWQPKWKKKKKSVVITIFT